MGTTLTGTTPQDTYDSLIKVTDNGPLSGSLKKLTDGLGNDSSLSLSTTAASLSGTLAVTGATTLTSSGVSVRLGSATGNAGANILIAGASTTKNWSLGVQQNVSGALEFTPTTTNGATTLGTTPAMVILDAGNVGIGTSAPESKLHIADTVSGGTVSLFVDNNINALNTTAQIKFTVDAGGTITAGGAAIQAVNVDPNFASTDLVFRNSGNSIGSLSEAMRITGIGTSYLRLSTTIGGIQFNGDTAAANALDDYEEGTWTPAIAFGGASVGLTYVRNSGTYTKIGRQVTVCGDLILSAKGSSTGSVTITGLPFTIGAVTNFLPVPSFRFADMSFSGFVQGYGGPATTIINMENVTSGAGATTITHADFEDATQLMVTLTYFV